MRLTTGRYFTPSGRSIQAKGISPDIEVLQGVPEELKARTNTRGELRRGGSHIKSLQSLSLFPESAARLGTPPSLSLIDVAMSLVVMRWAVRIDGL